MPPIDLRAEALKESGNQALSLQLYPEARRAYVEALQRSPGYTDAWFNLSVVLDRQGLPGLAAVALEHLLSLNPNDHEARLRLAEHRADQDRLPDVIAHVDRILADQPGFDPARRLRQYWSMQRWAGQNPSAAQAAYLQYAKGTLAQAQTLLADWLTARGRADLLAAMRRVHFAFAPTQGTDHTAEYTAEADTVRLSPPLAYARPNVLAAYLAHELEHARDRDGVTSLWEEEDGYRSLAVFWQAHAAGTQEPNLDNTNSV